jgi:hypothetical protein
MKFAKRVFWIASIWGFIVLTPLYFMFGEVGRQSPPPITHPEFYYGFVAVAMVWQLAFLLIGRDPVRLRPMMIPAVLEKFTYVATVIVLYIQGRLASSALMFGAADLVLGLLFLTAFVKTPRSWNTAR